MEFFAFSMILEPPDGGPTAHPDLADGSTARIRIGSFTRPSRVISKLIPAGPPAMETMGNGLFLQGVVRRGCAGVVRAILGPMPRLVFISGLNACGFSIVF